MNPRPVIATLVLLGAALAGAQDTPRESEPAPAVNSGSQDDKSVQEVTVVLDPVGESPAPTELEAKSGEKPDESSTGTPAQEVTGEAAAGQPPSGAAPATTEEVKPGTPEDGLAVRVEKVQPGTGSVDPAEVKLLAPFPAKPMSPVPAGWHLTTSDAAPPFTREVEVSPGTKVTLTIRPHLLVPDADGAEAFAIPEPGYDHTLGFRQNSTVAAILSDSIRGIDENSKQLGTVIESLQQLLVSLPKTGEPAPQPVEKPATPRKR
ncbi:hypothetical protein JIN84_06730 [Luteolibacter yonseiensis]|uniref:Uncharacterized protein n=1 Tax=Luteolibacter yonseiensis TaxID=1144680 RepID=A0A934VAM3_9BACT|nr:hypothetical protein [Luteolibacter yonseiensis]MBK1815300.1 hypothetical protein [Luteolibacter yonseiensis]